MRGWPRRARRETQIEAQATSKLELPDDDCVAVAPDHGAVTLHPAMEQSAARARLEGAEFIAPEPFCPKRHQCRMSRAGHRVLVDPEIGYEHPAGDVFPFAARSDDGHAADLLQCCEIGRARPNRGLVGNLDDC